MKAIEPAPGDRYAIHAASGNDSAAGVAQLRLAATGEG
jgi:hypothetical protein